ncbi:BMP family ABC transporter substrate-binding protein [Cellulomonas triticagri]|uniref:BMP family ABC transporter substrate-binding protein n=1 Tax=Cellulomonas triticagri TaxID=2483352 RepID=UPI0018F7C7E2|nr:BMP family ABC transporter substrate-binding protein [Cellulomonas triticagri]
MTPRRPAAVLAAVAVLLALGGCAGASPAAHGGSTPPVGPTAPALAAPSPTPDAAAPVLAVVGGPAPAVEQVVAAVTGQGAEVLPAATPASGDPESVLVAAADAEPDVVVVVGADLVDALDRVSSQRLGQQFLVVGAQLPEPTANVTAVVWPGADARWAVDAPTDAAVLLPRVAEATVAGLASVADGDGDRATVLTLD